jgi:hypothetical protein
MSLDLKDRRILKSIVNNNFTFSDLSKRFEGVDSSTGNIFCPFHDNSVSPSAKMYYDENRNIFVIHCFKEHRTFTTFDYVDKIVCYQREQYKSVLDFLENNMSKTELITQYKLISKNIELFDDNFAQKKIEYIDNLYNECENTVEYIEKLYTE